MAKQKETTQINVVVDNLPGIPIKAKDCRYLYEKGIALNGKKEKDTNGYGPNVSPGNPLKIFRSNNDD